MADPASGRCWLFYYPSLTSLLVLLRPVGKPNFNILDPQGPVPRKTSGCKTLANPSKTPTGLRPFPVSVHRVVGAGNKSQDPSETSRNFDKALVLARQRSSCEPPGT